MAAISLLPMHAEDSAPTVPASVIPAPGAPPSTLPAPSGPPAAATNPQQAESPSDILKKAAQDHHRPVFVVPMQPDGGFIPKDRPLILSPSHTGDLSPEQKAKLDNLQAKASTGDSAAEIELANDYLTGNSVPLDFAQAMVWYKKAAAQGDPKAENNLGWMYQKGMGVSADLPQAVQWYEKAAQHGLAQSQTTLGALYLSGQGVNKDNTVGLSWLQKAADQGMHSAQMQLGSLYYYGDFGVPQNYELAAKYYSLAVATKDPVALNNLGTMYRFGYHFPVDLTKAVELYQEAANQGNAKAQSNLGSLYYYGYGIPQDRATAYKWFSLSAAQKEITATKFLWELEKTFTDKEILQGKKLADAFHPSK